MKKVNFVLRFLLITFLIFLIAQPQLKAQAGNYDFSAHIHKEGVTTTTGVVIKTFEEIFIDGGKEAEYITEKRNINMGGQNISEESQSVIIISKDFIVTYDPETRKGTKMKNNFTDKFSGMSESDMKKMAEQMGEATNTNVTEEGTEEIAGKICKKTKAVTDLMGMKTTTTTWMYKNYVMQNFSDGSGTNIRETVKEFNENVKIDPLKFIVPDDVEISEVTSPY